jgi:ABC-2 type transport system ATP-binding protein
MRMERLGKRYGRRTWALRDCTLELPERGIIGLVGANGAGKTTLLQLAIGLIKPTEGTVTRRGTVGFVAQDHPLYKGFTVADMVRFGAKMNSCFDPDDARTRLEALGIPLDRKVGKLSGGQQAQVALTLALAKRPGLLVLDEPVASLDPLARRDFMRTLVDAVAERELTVLLSSHGVGELERVCDHLVLLDQGQVLLAGDIDDLLSAHRVLSGPAVETEGVEGLISASHGARNSNLLVRQPEGVPLHPRWESHPVSLEELVLGYMQMTRKG